MEAAPGRAVELPGVEPGRRGWLIVVGFGVVFAAVTCALTAILSDPTAFGFFAILLGMIAAVYLGFALNDGRIRALNLECVGMVVFGVAAVVALSEDSAELLAAGYVGHALWDAIHHRRGLDTAMPWWYVPLCLSYDTVVAAYILIRFA
jgi:Family of unknown function (DUF6010)